MTRDHHARGGATVAILSCLEGWEANVILNLRLWCDGPKGQHQIWNEYRRALPAAEAQHEMQAFEALLRTLVHRAYRPLVRHDVSCSCVGSDECVFLNLVRTAADGHLTDAALISTLLVGPAEAERIALLAGQVGQCVRRIHAEPPAQIPETASNVVRLH
ncbi:MAG: hypothetical protein AAGE76_11580 [Pseudomonadota bacterium]